MLNNISAITALFIGGSILTVGDIVFKFHVQKANTLLYTIGLAIYLMGTVFLVHSYKTQNIAVASTIFMIVNIVTLSLISWLYFGEKLSSGQILGVILAFAAIWLLEMGN